MTHDELVERAVVWLKGRKRCSVVVSELKTMVSETPDAIGWYGNDSILVEAKANIQDFKLDKKKEFRMNSDCGMGVERYYMIPKEMIKEALNILPEKWGLLLCAKNRIYISRYSERFKSNKSNEIILLKSIICRIYRYTDEVKGVGVTTYNEFPNAKKKAILFIDKDPYHKKEVHKK